MTRGDRGEVEEAKAHRAGRFGVVAGRPHRDECVLRQAAHDLVDRRDHASDRVRQSLPRAGADHNVLGEIDEPLSRRGGLDARYVFRGINSQQRVIIKLRRGFPRQHMKDTRFQTPVR